MNSERSIRQQEAYRKRQRNILIKELSDVGWTTSELVKRFGLTPQRIRAIIRRERDLEPDGGLLDKFMRKAVAFLRGKK